MHTPGRETSLGIRIMLMSRFQALKLKPRIVRNNKIFGLSIQLWTSSNILV